MRRKDREMNAEFALEVADKCEWAVIAMIGRDLQPYCLPLSIVRDNNVIYFHSAKDGLKSECLRANNSVCITCVGDTFRPANEFTTEYESAIVRGKAYEVTLTEEKISALRMLCRRHTPNNMDKFDAELGGSLTRTAVWKVEIEKISGKRKKCGSDA